MHDGRVVATAVAVVDSGPHGDQILVLEPELVALHHKLVRACDHLQAVDVAELVNNFAAEFVPSSTGISPPGINILGIRPHQIGEGTFMRDLEPSFEQSDLVKSFNVRGKASMDTENFAFYLSTDAKVVENFAAVFPGIQVAILANNFVVETVGLGDSARLVVTSEKGDTSRILQFQAHQKLEGLNRVVAAIHEISHEHIARLGHLASVLE